MARHLLMEKKEPNPPTPHSQEKFIAEQFELRLGIASAQQCAQIRSQLIRRQIHRILRANSQLVLNMDTPPETEQKVARSQLLHVPVPSPTLCRPASQMAEEQAPGVQRQSHIPSI